MVEGLSFRVITPLTRIHSSQSWKWKQIWQIQEHNQDQSVLLAGGFADGEQPYFSKSKSQDQGLSKLT